MFNEFLICNKVVSVCVGGVWLDRGMDRLICNLILRSLLSESNLLPEEKKTTAGTVVFSGTKSVENS